MNLQAWGWFFRGPGILDIEKSEYKMHSFQGNEVERRGPKSLFSRLPVVRARFVSKLGEYFERSLDRLLQ